MCQEVDKHVVDGEYCHSVAELIEKLILLMHQMTDQFVQAARGAHLLIT